MQDVLASKGGDGMTKEEMQKIRVRIESDEPFWHYVRETTHALLDALEAETKRVEEAEAERNQLITAADELLRLRDIKGTPEYNAISEAAAWVAFKRARFGVKKEDFERRNENG